MTDCWTGVRDARIPREFEVTGRQALRTVVVVTSTQICGTRIMNVMVIRWSTKYYTLAFIMYCKIPWLLDSTSWTVRYSPYSAGHLYVVCGWKKLPTLSPLRESNPTQGRLSSVAIFRQSSPRWSSDVIVRPSLTFYIFAAVVRSHLRHFYWVVQRYISAITYQKVILCSWTD